MSGLSVFFLVVSIIYLVAYFIEIPIFYEGNPKTRFFIKKMGKKNYKFLLLGFGVLFLILAFVFK